MSSAKAPSNLSRPSQKAKTATAGVPAADLGPGGEPVSQAVGSQRGEEEAFELVSGNENLQEMLDQLRDQFIVYKETKSRCKVQLKAKCKLPHSFRHLNLNNFCYVRRGG